MDGRTNEMTITMKSHDPLRILTKIKELLIEARMTLNAKINTSTEEAKTPGDISRLKIIRNSKRERGRQDRQRGRKRKRQSEERY